MSSEEASNVPCSSACSNGSGENSNATSTPACMDRFSKFEIHVKNAIEEISSGVSEEQYVEHLGKLSVMKKSKSAPRKMQKKLKTGLIGSLSREIEAMVEEVKLKESLQKLEKLVDESVLEEGQETWRPNGIVNDQCRSHLMEVKLKYKNEMERLVAEEGQEIEHILRNVNKLRNQSRCLESRLLILKSQCEDSSVVDKIDKKVIAKADELNNI